MRVKDVMTQEVATVQRDTPLKDVARLLVERRISGVPVCDAEGAVIGVVSEADILVKEEGLERPPKRALSWMGGSGADMAKIAARTAGESMTAPPITIAPSRPVAEAARLMIDRSVNRLPVVRDGQLVGIVTRADLVAAFTRTDDEIRHEIVQEVFLETLWIPPERLTLSVDQGRVAIAGELDTETETELVVAFARRVPGVIEVDSSRLRAAQNGAARSRG